MASYIDLQRRFWTMHRENLFTTQEITLYQYILWEANVRRWPEPLAITNREICMSLGIAESTLWRTRANLAERGIIRFEPGQTKRQSPLYYLQNESKNTSKNESKRASKNESNNETNNESNPKDYLQNKGNNESKNESIYKDNKDIVGLGDACARGDSAILSDEQLTSYYFDGNLNTEIEALCRQLRVTVGELRENAAEVLNDWRLTGETHCDRAEQRRHFINHLRAKTRIKKTAAPVPQARTDRVNRQPDKAPRNVNDRWANFKMPEE